MKLNLMNVWSQSQDLNFGEISEVVALAERAADDEVFRLRKLKMRAAQRHEFCHKTLARPVGRA